MKEETLKEILGLCDKFSSDLRRDLLNREPGLNDTRYRSLFWPPWVLRFNESMERLARELNEEDLELVYREMMKVGQSFLLAPVDEGLPCTNSGIDDRPDRKE